MDLIMVVSAAFGLTVSEAKTETMRLRTKGMPEPAAIFSVEAAGQVYNQTNGFDPLGRNVNHNANLSIEAERRIRNAWCSFRKYTLELYARPSALLELEIRMPKAEVLKTMMYGCVSWSPRAYHYETFRRTNYSFLTRCTGSRNNNRTDHQTFYLDTFTKTGSENIDAIMCRRPILFAGFVARIENTRLPKCVMFGEPDGGCELRGGAGRRVDGVSSERAQSFRYQRRPVDNCSPERGGMAQDGGTRGGTFHGEIDRCRESQAWTTACNSMPEHDGKDSGEDSPKQACSCWFARHS